MQTNQSNTGIQKDRSSRMEKQDVFSSPLFDGHLWDDQTQGQRISAFSDGSGPDPAKPDIQPVDFSLNKKDTEEPEKRTGSDRDANTDVKAPDPFEIEEAGLSELDLLMHWRRIVLEEVFAQEFPRDPAQADQLMEENRRYYQQQLGSGHRAYWVKNRNGEIVGCGGICLYQEMPSPDNPNGLCSYFMNIYTLPAFRHQGAASLLVRTLICESIHLKANKIYLETSESGRPVYLETGFQEMKGYLKYCK